MDAAKALECSFNNDDCTLIMSVVMMEISEYVPHSPLLVYKGRSSNAEIAVTFNKLTKQTSITIRKLRPVRRGQKAARETKSDLGRSGEGGDPASEGGLQADDWLGQLFRRSGSLVDRPEDDSE